VHSLADTVKQGHLLDLLNSLARAALELLHIRLFVAACAQLQTSEVDIHNVLAGEVWWLRTTQTVQTFVHKPKHIAAPAPAGGCP
jgi:hypothetical protein